MNILLGKNNKQFTFNELKTIQIKGKIYVPFIFSIILNIVVFFYTNLISMKIDISYNNSERGPVLPFRFMQNIYKWLMD